MAQKKETTVKRELDEQSKKTGEILAKEPKVKIRIAPDVFGQGDQTVPVCINGYHYFIRRGETVEVPSTVAKILEEANYL